ncbi:MAG: hypothetical protein HYY24_05700 [Verrucomicrobia bacterium]|nr:hypothetical protein [Verrucomicrobiota bacterium]
MRTLLVLAKESGLAAAVRAVLDPDRYRIVSQEEIWAAEPMLRQGAFDACFFDAEHIAIRPTRVLEKLRQQMPDCPLFVFTGARQWEWDEEAYLLGVAHVLTKPIRGRLLNVLLDRLWEQGARSARPGPAARAEGYPRPGIASAGAQVQALEVLRDFSAILSHSLDTEALLNDFLLLLRRLLGVNRAAIFLRKPPRSLTEALYAAEDRSLRAACASGLPPNLLQHFELSLEAGIGGFVHRYGRILVHGAGDALADAEVHKEFELLGAQVAVPILDRESFVGVALFDGRLTGEPISHEELALVFHLLEALGLAIKNGWLHDQLAASHTMMADVLGQLSGGCVVVSRDLSILHANPAAKNFFTPREGRHVPLEFSDLPQALGGKVFEVLKTGASQPAFKYEPPEKPGTVFLAAITPFKRKGSAAADAALLMVEDFSQLEHAQQLELEASRLRLVKTMAEGLAHEIGNCLVPLSTHEQLMQQKFDDPEFRASLSTAMADAVKRIARLSNQLLFLSRDTVGRVEPIRVHQLLEEAFREAESNYPEKNAELRQENGAPVLLSGDRVGLKHALAEVMLNALQANPIAPKIQTWIHPETDQQGKGWVRIEIHDAGAGFTSETAKRALDPFFTTRNVGLGLGLTVARKIVEAHHGRVELGTSGSSGLVVITLPISPVEAAAAAPQNDFNGHENTIEPVKSAFDPLAYTRIQLGIPPAA